MIFRGAPHLIISYVEKPSTAYPPNEDAVIALTTLELLCQKDQVGTFWAGFFKDACVDPMIRNLLGIEHCTVYSCMCMGKSGVHFKRPAPREDVEMKFI